MGRKKGKERTWSVKKKTNRPSRKVKETKEIPTYLLIEYLEKKQ